MTAAPNPSWSDRMEARRLSDAKRWQRECKACGARVSFFDLGGVDYAPEGGGACQACGASDGFRNVWGGDGC